VKVFAAAFACASVFALVVLILGGTVGSAAVSGADVTYTSDADWDQGTLVNTNHTAPNSNQLQLNEDTSTFPFIWVALSARGTIAKIDTRDGTILGEYSTTSDLDQSHNPSRTTVALDGSAWAGNRNQSSAIHVGLKEANQCVDRNGNGVIDTSTGYGDVKLWPVYGVLNPVSTALDECILHYVDTRGGDARHVSVTPANQIWIGSYSGSHYFHLIDNATGSIIREEGPFACGGYGGLVDGNGVIWSASSGSSLLRWDPNQELSATNPKCLPINNYGLAIDGQGNIWAATLGEGKVRKVAPDGTVLGTFSQGQSYAQGLAVDGNDHVWISSSLFGGTQVSHLKNDGSYVGAVQLTLNETTSNGPTGIAVDSAGKIWSANINSSDATRIDPNAGPLGVDGSTKVGAVDLRVNLPEAYPYNYSDMTGAALLRSTAPQGTWSVVQDGGALGKNWGTVRWNQEAQGSVPAGSLITVEVRAADTEAGLGSQAFAAVSNDTPFALTGRFLEVRVTLRPNEQGQSPVLSDIRVCAVGGCVAAAPQQPPAAPPPPPAAVRPPPPRTPRAARRCAVPNVRGKTVRAAGRAIVRAGCRTVVMGRRYSAATKPGHVLGQSIRPGARVRRGTIVRLVLSRGVQPAQPARRPPFTG
jgi:sugar lactone lactonase YvrE